MTNTNKREYVLLKAQKMLWGTVEAQMSSIIDAFHSLVPRELVDKYGFTPLEMQMLVCGEQHIDMADLRQHCKYEDGYTGKEPQIAWFWQAVDSMDEAQRRALLQFWSGSDGMPAEGFGSLEPSFHLVSVDRMYDRNDRTARLPAAHTCFRQLDLPRYTSYEELREKVMTAITMGQVGWGTQGQEQHGSRLQPCLVVGVGVGQGAAAALLPRTLATSADCAGVGMTRPVQHSVSTAIVVKALSPFFPPRVPFTDSDPATSVPVGSHTSCCTLNCSFVCLACRVTWLCLRTTVLLSSIAAAVSQAPPATACHCVQMSVIAGGLPDVLH